MPFVGQSLPIPPFILISIGKVAYLPWAILRYTGKKEGTLIKILLFLNLIKLFTNYLVYGFWLGKIKIYSSESRQSTSGDACIQLSIYRLKPAVKLCNRWTTPLSRIPPRIHLFSGKITSFAALKKTGINVEVTQLDEKIFVRLSRQLEMVNWKAYRKDRKLLQNSPNSHDPLGKRS